MYQYNDADRRLVSERVAQFKGQTERYLAGRLNENEFRQYRLRNGLYEQRHAPMLRVAIPYGVLSSGQLRALAYIAREYDKGYAHFTTRQNIQFNWPRIEQVPDILQTLANVDMHAIQTSGNVVRNITTDHLAGVAADEVVDPRPYCEILRQWSTLHPEFNWLPRKFKIAISGAREDRAAIRLHDIGLQMIRNESGRVGFRVYVGGGLGRTPMIGKLLTSFLGEHDLLSYVEAILRVYNLNGRRDNLYKARIKILVDALGVDQFRQQVEEEWRQIKDGELRLERSRIDGMKIHFMSPQHGAPKSGIARVQLTRNNNPVFNAWYEHNTVAHKRVGYRIVTISLKAPTGAPGDLTADQMDAVAQLADQYSGGELRVSHEQNLVLADVMQADLIELWRALRAYGLAAANIGTLGDMICCPGLDYCAQAHAGTVDIAQQINARFKNVDTLHALGNIRLNISGCINSCGHHHVGDIGILGVRKQDKPWYQIMLGGSIGADVVLGKRLGPAVSEEAIVDIVERITQIYLEYRDEGESFARTIRRIGIRLFKEKVYEDHTK